MLYLVWQHKCCNNYDEIAISQSILERQQANKDDRQIATKLRHNFHFLPHFNSQTYWTYVHQIFTQCWGIIAAINAILLSVSKRQSKEWKQLSFDSNKKPPKLNGYHSNVAWATAKLNANLIIPIHMSTKAENLVKIGPVLAEIFTGICPFFAILSKKVQLVTS